MTIDADKALALEIEAITVDVELEKLSFFTKAICSSRSGWGRR